MIDMKINQMSYYQRKCLLNTTQGNTTSKNMVEMQKHFGNDLEVDVKISESGINLLREKLGEFERGSDYINDKEVKTLNTNEIAWEHYTEMRNLSSLKLKDGNYNLEDVMKSMMDTYESLYNKIVKVHENGDRQVSYKLTGKRSLTLEEDLAGLDEAFNMRLADLEGYITCQQTNKAFEHPDSSWYFRRNNMQTKAMEPKDYNYLDKEYRNTAVSLMEQAHNDFLELFNNQNYKKGASIGVISDILNKNEDFMEKTQKLFDSSGIHVGRKSQFFH